MGSLYLDTIGRFPNSTFEANSRARSRLGVGPLVNLPRHWRTRVGLGDTSEIVATSAGQYKSNSPSHR